MSAGRYELNDPDVVSDVLDGEAVIINLDTGVYFRATGDACTVWEAVIGGAASDTVGESGREEFERLLASLTSGALIRPRSDAAPATVDAVPRFAPGSLVLDSHDDLQDLLALDPVHDVESAAGWPEQPAG